MSRSPQQQRHFSLAVLFAAGPLVAGGIAALSRRHDMRLLWMALASGLIALSVSRSRYAKSPGGMWVATFIFGTLVAAAAAYRLGARAPFGVWAVAIVMAFFWATSVALFRKAAATDTEQS